jgi:L-arabinonolactonase
MTQVRLAFDADNHLGETPIWSEADQTLWWINCEHPPELHNWSPETGQHRKWPMPLRIGGFAPKASGGLIVALANGLYDFNPESGALDLRIASPLPSHVKLHESAVDRQGRFWIGGYDHHFPANRAAAGAIYFRLDGDHLTPVIEGTAVANGLAFSPDGRTIYAADAAKRKVEAWDLDPASGAVSHRRPFLALVEGEGFVDGATVDSQGGYWLANVGAGRLRRYLPNGSLDRIIDLPFSNPTKPVFGGPGFKTLYITSTKLAVQSLMMPTAQNGAIYALEPGECGVPEMHIAD